MNATRRKKTQTKAPPEQMASIEEGFDRRLHRLMLEKRLSQSDLARGIWGTTRDNRGLLTAKNRSQIGLYLKGKAMPSELTLAKIAGVLGVDVSELVPPVIAKSAADQTPSVSMTALAGQDGGVLLTVNRVVPLAVAVRVMQIISDEVGDTDD